MEPVWRLCRGNRLAVVVRVPRLDKPSQGDWAYGVYQSGVCDAGRIDPAWSIADAMRAAEADLTDSEECSPK